MANGRFDLGEDVRWTSFAKTFDVVGKAGSLFLCCRMISGYVHL